MMISENPTNRSGLHLHLNGLYGVAGDMFLSALIDLGADAEQIEQEFLRLEVGIERIRFTEVMRASIRGTYMIIDETDSQSDSTSASQEVTEPVHAHSSEDHVHAHHHHGHDHEHHHHHHHAHAHSHSRVHGPHRHLKDMLDIVDRSNASPWTKDRATRILTMLAEAEGRIHGKQPTDVHFHELSGVDTIIDVLGTCMAIEMLGISSITATTITTGYGTFTCEHGTFAVPAPATLEILARASIPCQPGRFEAELLTPTGAALLAVLVDEFGWAPPMTPERVGYGAGTYDAFDCPNLLQATLGHRSPATM